MFRQLQYHFFWLFLPVIAFGCAPSTTTTRTVPIPVTTANTAEIGHLRHVLDAASSAAHSLYVEGDITLDQNGETNSASFVMRSKRRDDNGRIDSLSIEIKGPFGIKVARFLASPSGYKFSDILHGETMSGRMDAAALEELTHLRGITLSMMSDLAYGLAPGVSEVSPVDSTTLVTEDGSFGEIVNRRDRLIIRRPELGVTELAEYTVGSGPLDGAIFQCTGYSKWNGDADPFSRSRRPDIAIKFDWKHINNPKLGQWTMPDHIVATAGENILTLDYTKIDLNPSALTVKIKMPD